MTSSRYEIDELKLIIQHEHELREQALRHAHAMTNLALDEHEKHDLLRHAEIDQRLEAMNKLRTQIEHERTLYMERGVYEREHKALTERVNALELTGSRLSGSFWAMGAMISAVVAVITIAVDLIFKGVK